MPRWIRFAFAALIALVLREGQPRAEEPQWESTVSGESDAAEVLPEERATSHVKRRDIERRLPRSTPDALRYEPGVFVQQSGHAMGSAFLRGLTGQQTLMLFDGVRLNNATYRQGPNQYFFTVDVNTLRGIDVLRGGGSTTWGSDALGGVLDALPLDPILVDKGTYKDVRLVGQTGTADSSIGGRLQLELSKAFAGGAVVGFLGGVGGRDVGQLTGPPVRNPNQGTAAGPYPWVPRYEEFQSGRPFSEQPELRTMHGTGFKELTGDARLVIQPNADNQVTLAAYLYRQFDAPRTDHCPPPSGAILTQCLTYEQQFRTLAYAAWNGKQGRFADRVRVTLSWQEQHEVRRFFNPSANRIDRGYDDLETFGATARLSTERLEVSPWIGVRVDYGADTYVDWLRSRAVHFYTDLPAGTMGSEANALPDSRGQYLNGSTYLYGGAWAELNGELGSRWTVRGGARVSWVRADAPDDSESGSKAVHRGWFPVVGHLGVEAHLARPLHLFLNYDNSYRAPNLDDLTARQQTGPGFQFENAALEPEHAHTFELGARLRSRWVSADLWLYEMLIQDNILKVSKRTEECPPSTPQCDNSWSRYQLQNAPGLSEVRGVEAGVRVPLPLRFALRATAAYTWSEGPRVGQLPKGDIGFIAGERVPLSKTPPLNGVAELSWTHPAGFVAAAALQWAGEQDRLSIADSTDGRIPKFGTPGFAVVHLRASYRFSNRATVTAVLENLFDSPYRFHGSSVNGAGRSINLYLALSPLS